MKFLPAGYNVSEIEKGAKNKWRWEWLGEVDACGIKWGEWLKKPDICGMAFCTACGKTINYKSSGKKVFRLHAEDLTHQKNTRIVKSNQVLPGSSKCNDKKVEGMMDRVAKQRAILTSFISEHCLPFTLADDILELAKRLAADRQALEKTTVSPTSATYINTHGVAKAFKDEVKSKVKDQLVSLNLDEATNKNQDKVLNILVQYFDSETNKIVIDHLGSRIQNVATAVEIVKSIGSVLEEYEIAWKQIVSVLMDNCSTMRGEKGGVETLIREKNGLLLDISGDTIHMLSNVAKTLMKSTDQGIQNLCSNIYYDIEKSPKVREILCQIMTLMNAKKAKHVLRPIDNRFLQMQDVTSRVVELLDYLTVYYASFLSGEEKDKYRPLLEQIFKSNDVSAEAQVAVTVIQMNQNAQPKSNINHDRKDLILDALFTNRTETVVKLNLCRGLLGVFQEYVKKFQKEVPQIHLLHENMVDVTKKFLSLFIKPEKIPERVSHLMKLDVEDVSIQKADKDLSVGQFATNQFGKGRLDKAHWIQQLYRDLRKGYIQAAKKILKLPLNNSTLRYMSVLDPAFHSHGQCSKAFRNLARQLPNVVPEEDMGSLDSELNSYAVDRQVALLAANYKDDCRVDEDFWGHVRKLKTFEKQRYPVLSRLACSLLTAFSGPLVEGTFNIMGDIIEDDRATMAIENYEAVAIVKMGLKRKSVTANKMVVTPNMKKSVIHAHATYQQYLKFKKEAAERKRQEQLDQSIQQLKNLKAKHLLKLQKKAQLKRKQSSDSLSCRKFKRIKTVL